MSNRLNNERNKKEEMLVTMLKEKEKYIEKIEKENSHIKLAKKINNRAKHLGIKKDQLIDEYLLKVDYKYTIKEKQIGTNNFACVFFDLNKKQCSIYEVRPTQCRTFPFWEYFKNNINEVKEECPAIVI